jgi:hypothetical protein
MTNPIELCKRGTDEIVAYAGAKCGAVVGSARTHGDAAREIAENHCGPWTCRVCGNEHDWSHQRICRSCWNKQDAERRVRADAERRAKATEIPAAQYDGWVTNGDKFWPDVNAMLDDVEEGKEPAWVWGCKCVPFHIDAGWIIEGALEEHHKDAGDAISNTDVERLQKMIDQWCNGMGIESWEPDYTRVVLLGSLHKRSWRTGSEETP